jgi:hypothetical protein
MLIGSAGKFHLFIRFLTHLTSLRRVLLKQKSSLRRENGERNPSISAYEGVTGIFRVDR